jgi:hypothetical protein
VDLRLRQSGAKLAPVAATDHLRLAREHLLRVQAAWDAPTDWSDLALYGFYCLENAVVAASLHVSIDIRKSHPSKAEAAKELSSKCGLPDVSGLLVQLNDARKAVAYGDVTLPDLDPEELAAAIEQYVEAMEVLLGT